MRHPRPSNRAMVSRRFRRLAILGVSFMFLLSFAGFTHPRYGTFSLSSFFVTPLAAQESTEHAPTEGAAAEHAAAGEHGAAEGEAHGEEHDVRHEVYHYANFFILLGLIIWGVKKGLIPFLNERGRLIRADMQRSAEAIEQASARLSAMEERMSDLDRELAQLQSAGMDEARKERLRIEKEAEAEATKILAAANMEMDSAVKAARQDLQSYASQLALNVAEKKIMDSLTPASDKQILNAFVERLGDVAAGSNDGATDGRRKN